MRGAPRRWLVGVVALALIVFIGCAEDAKPRVQTSSSVSSLDSQSTTTTTVAPSSTAPLDESVVLGVSWSPAQDGYGESRPTVISNGGDPTGIVAGISWDSWGGPTATGHGTGSYVGPDTPSVADATQERATVVAANLGDCAGVQAYRSVTWFFAEKGQTLDQTELAASDICVAPNGDCHYSVVAHAAPLSDAGPGQRRLNVVLTNRSIVPCDVSGYPVVNLVDANSKPHSVSQQAGGDASATVVLSFEHTAHFVLTYIDADAGSAGFMPSHANISYGDVIGGLVGFAWEWGPVAPPDGGPNPSTNVSSTASGP